MPKLGSLYYPTIGVTEAADIARGIERDFKGSITTAGLASHLSMAESGGAFSDKLTALNRYGLVSGRGTLTVSALGQRLTHPGDPAERDRSMAEAFLNIELFRGVHERLADTVPEEGQLRIILEEVTGASRRDVSGKLARIQRLYAEGVRFVSSGTPGEPDRPIGAMYEEEKDMAPQGQIVITDNEDRNSFDRSLKGIGLLRMYVDLLEKKIQLETSEEETGDDVE